ncbi:hypothetical protein [Candidatus Binatus soli]|jgi:hypothetical protein|uniref:hypothetical protein n=1 Tax=Candidatus Binatus soli TaxID=1953413 RepID=UPI003D0CA650
MASLGQVTFVGSSGNKYVFEIYALDTKFKDDFGAIYIFSHQTNVGTHTPVYIGETDQLGIRIPKHEKWPCVRRERATHICIHAEANERLRKAKEQDLIAKYDPPCNLE